ncbi:MAG TPA: ribosome silencing factor [Saprospiraceae bacterium]|nr:ribosome silencing factor [Saprospiraceae bacterium]
MIAKAQRKKTSQEEILNNLIIDAIQDIKGKNILKLDLGHLSDAPTSCFIICEGDSITQVRAISESINRKVRDTLELRPNHIEGLSSCKWVLVDYFDTIVHVFYPETREHYGLEELWSDAIFTEYENL